MRRRQKAAKALEELFCTPAERMEDDALRAQGRKIVRVNGRQVDMTTHVSSLNSLVSLGGPPPAEDVPEIERFFGVKWDAEKGTFS